MTTDEILKIAKLAKINLSQKEAEKFAGEFSRILDFFKILEKVDTENVAEISQISGIKNIFRADKIEKFAAADEILGCSKNEIENNSIKIPKII